MPLAKIFICWVEPTLNIENFQALFCPATLSSKPLSHLCHNHAGPSREIKMETVFLDEKSRFAEETGHGVRLGSTNLDKNPPFRRQQPGRRRRDLPVSL
jgi:hypothetical protein